MMLYEMLLPTADNEGIGYEHDKLSDFLSEVSKIAGGYSLPPIIQGSWTDPTDGKTYIDAMQPVRVGITPSLWPSIVALACKTWPDQEAIMHYSVGRDVTFTRTDGNA